MVVESDFSTSFSTSFHQKYLKITYSSLTPKTTKKSPQIAGNPWFSLLFREIFLSDLKPLAGLEPATHALRMRCATNCATMAYSFKKIKPLQMQQPYQYDLTGNRTRVYAVRGRRLDRLTIRPKWIEATWFEHATSASRTQRSTKLSHTSIWIIRSEDVLPCRTSKWYYI